MEVKNDFTTLVYSDRFCSVMRGGRATSFDFAGALPRTLVSRPCSAASVASPTGGSGGAGARPASLATGGVVV